MHQLTLALSPGECADALQELVEQDAYIEDIETKVKIAKDTLKDLKDELKDAIAHRTMLSWRAREGAVPVEPAPTATTNPSDPAADTVTVSHADTSVTLDGAAFDTIGEVLERRRAVAGDLDDDDESGGTDDEHDGETESDDQDDDEADRYDDSDDLPDTVETQTVPIGRKRTG